jgi:hypothetical protein
MAPFLTGCSNEKSGPIAAQVSCRVVPPAFLGEQQRIV